MGLGIKKIAGKNTKTKRQKPKNSGGNSEMPTLDTKKFNPHMRIVRSARSQSIKGITNLTKSQPPSIVLIRHIENMGETKTYKISLIENCLNGLVERWLI